MGGVDKCTGIQEEVERKMRIAMCGMKMRKQRENMTQDPQ